MNTLAEAQTLGKLVHAYEGCKLVIPSVEDLSPTWRVDRSPHLEFVRAGYKEWCLQYAILLSQFISMWSTFESQQRTSGSDCIACSWFKDERTRQKLAACGGDTFAVLGFPRADPEVVLTIAKLIGWYFPWDDAIDDAAMLQQPIDVERYRDETLQLVRESLLTDRKTPSNPSSNPAIQSFWDIGVTIRARGNAESNGRFCNEQCRFIISSAQSQLDRKKVTPATVAEYMKRREDNIAIHQLMELVHYAYQIKMPPKYYQENNELMEGIFREVAWQGFMANDLLSLRRELIHGQFESMVPLLMYEEKLTPQKAIDRNKAMLHESYQRFYELEEALYAECESGDLECMKATVHAYKDLIMCNLYWSIEIKRYENLDLLQVDDTIVFNIHLPETLSIARKN